MAYGLYIHIPFCASKCPYCSFASYPSSEKLIPSYIDAVEHELAGREMSIFGPSPRTLYIGGGTPSTVPAEYLASLLRHISLENTIEFSVEANPESVSSSWLETMRSRGANRISIGVQSLDGGVLAALGRIHSADEAVNAVCRAKNAGFKNISIDLMFGIPDQTFPVWRETLERAIDLEVDHVSCYSLGIDEDSEYFRRMAANDLDLPEPELTFEMYALMRDMLENAGFRRYEISNFSKAGFESKHNSAYWDFSHYLGVGSSAHSYDGARRFSNIAHPEDYIRMIGATGCALAESEAVDSGTAAVELFMLSLRTEKGLPETALSGVPENSRADVRGMVNSMCETGLLTKRDGAYILTDCGVMIADEIIAELITIFA